MMINARITQKIKNAMQSGRAGTEVWLLEYEPSQAQNPDPLMGWAGSGDTRRQVSLKFPTQAAAMAYATANGLTAKVAAPVQKSLKLQAYADNFR
jgi:ETC complex I subunit conserved region